MYVLCNVVFIPCKSYAQCASREYTYYTCFATLVHVVCLVPSEIRSCPDHGVRIKFIMLFVYITHPA